MILKNNCIKRNQSSQYINEVIGMKKELLWQLFKNTGKIEYYIKWKNWKEGN